MKLNIYFMAIVAVLATACGKGGQEAKESTGDSAMTVSHESQGTVATDTTYPLAPASGQPAATDWDKKLIKTAQVTLSLNNYDSFNTSLHQQLRTFGAYVATEKETGSESSKEDELTIKVPVYQFEDLMNSITGRGVNVVQKEIATEDVTGELVDVKARLEAKKQVRERYLDLLKQSKNMKDILAVQQEINDVQADIEAADGRRSAMIHQAAYSTIHLRYYQYHTIQPDDTPGFGTKFIDAFKGGGELTGNVLLFFIAIWPLILLGVVVWIVYKKRGAWKVAKSV